MFKIKFIKIYIILKSTTLYLIYIIGDVPSEQCRMDSPLNWNIPFLIIFQNYIFYFYI